MKRFLAWILLAAFWFLSGCSATQTSLNASNQGGSMKVRSSILSW
ncbi:MAG: hypothetical protein WCS55_08185 [Sulfuricurvum sp.]